MTPPSGRGTGGGQGPRGGGAGRGPQGGSGRGPQGGSGGGRGPRGGEGSGQGPQGGPGGARGPGADGPKGGFRKSGPSSAGAPRKERPGSGGGGGGGGPRGFRAGGDQNRRGPARHPAGYAARRLAVDLVVGVSKGRLLDQLLDEGMLAERYQQLDPRDRGLTRAIVGVALRRHGQITEAIGRYLQRPLPDKALTLKAILDVAAAQILFMEVADHAAVALAVDMAGADKEAAPFKSLANAILRRVAAEKGLILRSQDPIALNTPAWLVERWTKAYGAETAAGIAAAHLVEPSLDLTVKSDPEGWAARLGGILLPTGSVRVASSGAVEKLDGYDEGAWWVQDAAATLPVRLLGDVRDRKVADLCAAPGGKTALLAHLGAKVTAVDLNGHRLARLTRNLFRLGLDATVLIADITEWMGGPFDMILLDAPCSATGTLRRHPDGALSKTEADVAKLAALQRRLLDQAIRMLRPGGLIVYSVCSLEPEEGPDQIRRLLLIDAPVERVPVASDEVFGLSDVITPEGDVRTLPTHLPHPDPRLAGLDGFYAARLRRRV